MMNVLSYALYFMCVVSIAVSTDFYELLGIPKDAENREIRKAFKKLALKYHPDKNKDKVDAQEKFIEINKAYEVLKDEEMRKKYDLHGEDGLKEDFGNSWHGNYRSWNYYYESFGIYDDDPEIITLSKSDFVQSVVDSPEMWFINFYSPQCSHCHHLAPAWRQIAHELQGVIRIGAVNCEEDWMLCRQQNIFSYPSLIIYPQREKYQGPREADAIIEYILRILPSFVIKLSSHDLSELISIQEYSSLPWLVFSCEDEKDCIYHAELKELAIILKHLVNVAEIDKGDDKLCEILNCNSPVTYYFNVSTSVPTTDWKSIVLDERETQDIVKKVLYLLPGPKELTDNDFQEIKEHLGNMTASPWLIHFTKGQESSPEKDIDLKRLKALLPEILLGHIDCRHFQSSCVNLYVQKFPAFLLFKSDGTHEFHYGRITAYDVAKFARDAVSSRVQTLSPEDFPHVVESGEPWFIDFFAPWCPPCMELLPEWRKASHDFGHMVNFGTVDCTVHRLLCQKYNIRSYPTAVLYNKSIPHTLDGSHSLKQIGEFIESILHPMVISLSPASFENLVREKKNDEVWVIDFFAPWCGPCQQLAPQWRKVAKMLFSLPSVHIGEVDCQSHYSLCNAMGVNSYPTIRLYPRGTMNNQKFHTFSGWSRDASSLQAWIYNYVPSRVPLLYTSEFNDVLSDEQPWLIDFFAPWCSHCQTFAPEFEKITEAVKGRVNTGKVNCDELPNICRLTGIRAYPTVVFYEGRKTNRPQNPVAEEVHTLTFNGILSFVEERLNMKFRKPSRVRDEL